jgi:hypothetical protein
MSEAVLEPGIERRGAPRVAAHFWVRLFGVDEELVERQGDISVLGIAFDCLVEVGELGSMQALEIASQDRRCSAVVLARVVRVLTIEAIGERTRRFSAFELIPDSVASQQAVENLVQHIAYLELGRSRAARVGAISTGEHPSATAPARNAIVSRLGLRALQLETHWPASVGDQLELLIRSPASDELIPFDGEITSVLPRSTEGGAVVFHVKVDLHETANHDKNDAGREPVELVFAEPVWLPERTSNTRSGLAGLLSRIPIAALLSLFDMQRMSGVLIVTSTSTTAALFIREGRVIDAELEHEALPPHRVVGRVLSWSEGRFEFTDQQVNRIDRLQASVPALLLSLAREYDEAQRDGDDKGSR